MNIFYFGEDRTTFQSCVGWTMGMMILSAILYLIRPVLSIPGASSIMGFGPLSLMLLQIVYQSRGRKSGVGKVRLYSLFLSLIPTLIFCLLNKNTWNSYGASFIILVQYLLGTFVFLVIDAVCQANCFLGAIQINILLSFCYNLFLSLFSPGASFVGYWFTQIDKISRANTGRTFMLFELFFMNKNSIISAIHTFGIFFFLINHILWTYKIFLRHKVGRGIKQYHPIPYNIPGNYPFFIVSMFFNLVELGGAFIPDSYLVSKSIFFIIIPFHNSAWVNFQYSPAYYVRIIFQTVVYPIGIYFLYRFNAGGETNFNRKRFLSQIEKMKFEIDGIKHTLSQKYIDGLTSRLNQEVSFKMAVLGLFQVLIPSFIGLSTMFFSIKSMDMGIERLQKRQAKELVPYMEKYGL